MQVDCIITAAGLSSRMGQWKMMLPWQSGTILDASIKNAQRFASHIILVTGFRHQELAERYSATPGITLVHNENYPQGLFSSVQVGVSVARTEYCFITHGDLPCLSQPIFQTLWAQRFAGALLPHYKGTPGHPILAPRAHLLRCLTQANGVSVRQCLLANHHRCVALDSPEIIFDIDTPDDFIRLNNQ